jgi:tetratricopeptide (TPR) repeat protein
MGFRESSPSSTTAKVIVEDLEFPRLNDFPDGLGNTLGRPVGDRPTFERSDPAPEVDIEEAEGNADDLPAIKRGGVGRWLFIIVVLAGLGALAYFAYVNIWLEQQQKEASAARADAELERLARAREVSAAEERQRLISEARSRTAAETLAGEEQARAAAKDEPPRPAPDPGKATPTSGAQAKPNPPPKPAKVPQEKPRNFDWYMSQASKLREKQQGQAALDAYAQAAELRPDRAEPFAGRGLTLLDMGDSDQAEASFQVALKLNPRYGAAVIGLARTYLAQGKKEKAIDSYEKYLEILPDGPEATAARQKLRQLKGE